MFFKDLDNEVVVVAFRKPRNADHPDQGTPDQQKEGPASRNVRLGSRFEPERKSRPFARNRVPAVSDQQPKRCTTRNLLSSQTSLSALVPGSAA
jgi:hypothetical protein